MFKRRSTIHIDQSAKTVVNPEELFADQVTTRQIDVVEERIEHPLGRFHLLMLLGIIALVLIIFLGRLFQISVLNDEQYDALAAETRLKTEWFGAPRGVIFDRGGTQLVYNDPVFSVIAIPALLPKRQAQLDAIVEQLATLIDTPYEQLRQKFQDLPLVSFRPHPLESGIEHGQALEIKSQLNDVEGIVVKENFIRRYEYGPLVSHTLGYTGRVTQSDLDADDTYLPIDQIGKDGIEAVYEGLLRGTHGKDQIEISARGEKQRDVITTNPVPGDNLTLTIDLQLQQKLDESLRAMLEREGLDRAAAVAIDPRDGGVLALVSIPSYDNNVFSRPLSGETYQSLLNDPDRPFFNRVISGQYSPASTVKPLVAIAALTEGIISPIKNILANGSISVPSIYNPAIRYTFLDWKVHGWVDMRKAIAVSSNVYFYTIGGGYQDIEGLGIGRLRDWWRSFGLGEPLGIDLPGEQSGVLPDPTWKENVKNEQWYIGDTYNVSIGQGDLNATPLQIAAYTAAVANGGTLYRPHLLKEVTNTSGETTVSVEPHVLNDSIAPASAFRVAREGMRRAVTDGSARALADLPIAVAGKTGTAQVGGDMPNNAWFTTFAPYDDPTIALTILIEHGDEGSRTAAPVARDVLLWYALRNST